MTAPIRHLITWCNDASNVFTFYAGTLLISAGLFGVFEGKGVVDSAWWAIVTAMTVGYGDISPVTIGGRLVAVALMHIMVFLIAPMFIGLVLSRILQDRNAFTHEEQEELKALLKRLSRSK